MIWYVEVMREGAWTLVGQYASRSQADAIRADYQRRGEKARVTSE